MRWDLRTRLFAVSVGLLLVAFLAGGFVLESQLRVGLQSMVELELFRHARAVRETVALLPPGVWPEAVDDHADRLAAAMDVRVTVIADDGRVLGDSELSRAELTTVDDHGTRPEVLGALSADGVGIATRHSATLDRSMVYVAVPFDQPGGGRGAIRASKPLALVDALLRTQRRWLLLSGAVGLLLASGMSWLASYWMTRGLRRLVVRSQQVARGAHGAAADEIATLSGSLESLAAELEHTVTALAAERGRFEAVLEGMTEAVVAFDPRCRVDLVNPRARALLAAGSVERGAPLDAFTDHTELRALVRRALLGEAVRAEITLGPRTVELAVAPLTAGGCVAVFHDVTGLRRLERVRKDFVANVSHELRTPIQAVRTTAEALQIGVDDPADHSWLLDTLARNAARLGSLVSDLLDLSRIEGGAYALAAEPVLVRDVVDEAVATVDPRGRTVSTDVPRSLRAVCDADALHQVVVNLLDNGCRHARDGGQVTVRARGGANVVLEVSDDGPGIPEEHRDRVFERFYRLDPGHSRAHGGTGLGLSIVRHLVRGMDGSVSIHANRPTGACVRVVLPALAEEARRPPVPAVDAGVGRQ